MDTTKRQKPLLSIRFTGPAIHDGRILLDDLQTFLLNLNLAIDRAIDVLEMGSSLRPGRPKKINQLASALEVVATRRGSFGLDLDLRKEDYRQLPPVDIGMQAIEKVMRGWPNVKQGGPLPAGFDVGVLTAIRDAGRVFDRGIDGVHIRGRKDISFKRFVYSDSTRQAVIASIKRFEKAFVTVEGRLLMADVKEDALRCRLHPSSGLPISCVYDESLVPQIVRNLRGFVKASGIAQHDPISQRIHSLTIYDLEPIEQIPEHAPELSTPSDFWEAKEFNILAMEQGVYPVEDINKLAGFPDDADFESFLKAVMSSREN